MYNMQTTSLIWIGLADEKMCDVIYQLKAEHIKNERAK